MKLRNVPRPHEKHLYSVGDRLLVLAMFSPYLYELNEAAKHRYKEKLGKAGFIDDPYVMEEQRIPPVDWQDWPRVKYPDLYNYLFETASVYTGESLRAYKSLDGLTFVLMAGFPTCWLY